MKTRVGVGDKVVKSLKEHCRKYAEARSEYADKNYGVGGSFVELPLPHCK